MIKPEDVKKYNYNLLTHSYRTVNRSTFKCPLCSQNNLDRKDIVAHVNKSHRGKPAVCPICKV
jgi:rubrerythrin